jgi:broad specificity phosphatase PhoE
MMLSIDSPKVLDPRTTTSVVTPTLQEAPVEHKKIIYFVRHAEALHNILERKAVEEAIKNGAVRKDEQEQARKSVLQNPSLRDSPLSKSGRLQARKSSQHLQELMRLSLESEESAEESKFQPPEIVLVSPLRRALMTATELFHYTHNGPRFVALEILREKRTGLACDERSSVEDLMKQFPHVEFDNLRVSSSPDPGEDNPLVRKRTKVFLDEVLSGVPQEHIAIVTHKGWLREMRHTLKSSVDKHSLDVDFDIQEWDQTLYKNAEIRVAEFSYREKELVSIVSRSIDNAISSIVV